MEIRKTLSGPNKIALRSDKPISIAQIYADTYGVQLKTGKSSNWAHAYASIIAEGHPPAYAKTYADTYGAQLKAGESDAWTHAYAIKIAEGESPQKAKVYANTQHPKS